MPDPIGGGRLLPRYSGVLPGYRGLGPGRRVWRAAVHRGAARGVDHQLLQTTAGCAPDRLCRADGPEMIALVAPLGDRPATREVTAERTVPNLLRGHCDGPIAGCVRAFDDGRLALRAVVFSRDGARAPTVSRTSDHLNPPGPR